MKKVKTIIKILKREKINKKLKKRKLEDLVLVEKIENFLKDKRGKVFTMPKPGESVVLMVSGGLDSIIIWDILLRKYKLNVYPLFLRRGQLRMPVEEKAVDFFSKFYKSKFKKLFHEPRKINTFIPPLEYRFEVTKHAEDVVNKDTNQWLGVPMYGTLMFSYAANYASFLELSSGIKPRTIFFGFVEQDGLGIPYETFTFTRLATYHLCSVFNDFSWQVSALALERELGFFFDKDVLINWASEHNIPIDKTFSCLEPHLFHCGSCDYCSKRRDLIIEQSGKDKTIYISRFGSFKIIVYLYSKVVFLIVYLNFFIKINYYFLRNLYLYFFGKR